MARHGAERSGAERQARSGVDRLGEAWTGRRGLAGTGAEWRGMAGEEWRGRARTGQDRQGPARKGRRREERNLYPELVKTPKYDPRVRPALVWTIARKAVQAPGVPLPDACHVTIEPA